MKNKKKHKTTTVNTNIEKPSIEYSTKELIDLGKKLNVLKLARPLYEDSDDNDKTNES